ncbi:MAG: hypothetical protein ACRCVG_04610 [Methanobacteriaceae archaeon]
MAKITKISPQQSNSERVSIYIDDEFAVGMKKSIAEDLGLEEGDEWTKGELEKIEKDAWKEAKKPLGKNVEGRISKIEPQQDPERVSIFLREKFAVGMTKIIAEELDLEIGQIWTIKTLKEAADAKWKELN